MNSVCFPKARIVEQPLQLSLIKLIMGDFETDSILVHSLYAGIVKAKSQIAKKNIKGRDAMIYQFAREITMMTDRP